MPYRTTRTADRATAAATAEQHAAEFDALLRKFRDAANDESEPMIAASLADDAAGRYLRLVASLANGESTTEAVIEATCKAAGKSRKELRLGIADLILGRVSR